MSEMRASDKVEFCDVPGGRRIAYQLYGDSGGRPFFFFHGSPASRLEAAFISDSASRHNIMLIAVDRPGIGGSDPTPGRHLLDWPGDVEQVADLLRVERFSVIGFSTGAMYAHACAYAMPERVERAIVISGVGSPSMMRGLNGGWLTLMAARLVPPLGRLMFGTLAKRANQSPDRFELPGLSAPDRAFLADAEHRRLFLASFLEAFKSGAQGVVADQVLVTRPWLFELAGVRVPVALWHGAEDRTVPVEVARRIATELAQATLAVVGGEGHITTFVVHADDYFGAV
jgi:pimeloyl-ACP methyl ester carboxylesterase